MERPKYHHELQPAKADFIALADALLEHKDPSNSLPFVDIVVQASPEDAYEGLSKTRYGQLLMQDDEQMALQSDGSYYPKLDLQKQNGRLQSVGLRVWGWESEKVRFADSDDWQAGSGGNYTVYQGETDQARELSISFSYIIGDKLVAETIKLYGSTSKPGLPGGLRSVVVPDYAETGYEGHAHLGLHDASSQDVTDFLELVADMVGEQPESYYQLQARQLQQAKQEVNQSGGDGSLVDKVLDATWPAQAAYLLHKTYKALDGKTLVQALTSQDLQDEARQVVDKIAARFAKPDSSLD